MPRFYSAFDRPKTRLSPMGSGERAVLEVRKVNGVDTLVKTGSEDWKSFIESSKAETMISNIILRFQRGDVSALSRTQGFYGDVTGMPDSLRDAQNTLIDLRSKFDALPKDVRLKFDDNFEHYVSKVSNFSVADFAEAFNLVPKSDPTTVTESEVE